MIVAIANQKGGVGKTITAATIGHGAALAGLKTLIIDLDPQGNIADSFGLAAGNELAAWLGGQEDGSWLAGNAVLARAGLWVLRSDKRTAALKTHLQGRGFVEYAIRDGLQDYTYDLIILDCAPSLDVLHTAALVAADLLLIPTRLDEYSVKGVAEILTTLAALRKRGGGCQLAGIIPTFYEKTTNESQGQLENLATHFGQLVWAPIPQDTTIREANRAGLTLWEYAPHSRALVQGYQPVLTRLLGVLK